MKRPEITEENLQDMFWSYTAGKYNDVIQDFYEECPYDLNAGPEEHAYSHVLMWLGLERRSGPSGRTTVDEFVEELIDDKRLARKMLRAKNVIHDEFLILRKPDADNVILARAESDQRKIAIKIASFALHMQEGGRIVCRIHPWEDDGTHLAPGPIVTHM